MQTDFRSALTISPVHRHLSPKREDMPSNLQRQALLGISFLAYQAYYLDLLAHHAYGGSEARSGLSDI